MGGSPRTSPGQPSRLQVLPKAPPEGRGWRPNDACITYARERGVDGVQRNAQGHGQPPLEGGRVEDRQVGLLGVVDGVADPAQQPRPAQHLLAEGPGRSVVRREERQPPAGVAGGNPREQLEVVVDDSVVDGLRGDEDEPRPRVAEPDHQEQQPLLVPGGAAQLRELAPVEGQRGHHHRGVGPVVGRKDVAPQLGEAGLEPLERLELALQRERFRLQGQRGQGASPSRGTLHASTNVAAPVETQAVRASAA